MVQFLHVAFAFIMKAAKYISIAPFIFWRKKMLDNGALHWLADNYRFAKWPCTIARTLLSLMLLAFVSGSIRQLASTSPFIVIFAFIVVLPMLFLNACLFLVEEIVTAKQGGTCPLTNAALQREAAGKEAEQYVANEIAAYQAKLGDAVALHGALFVFNEGMPNEFSAELDHLLITKHQIYAIETKYKSGRIQAPADALNWTVQNNQGQSTMRNALLQAKNSVKVLKREFGLTETVIPITAIYGYDVVIEDGPSNVVPADQLVQVIEAFEAAAQKPASLAPHIIAANFRTKIRSDQDSMEKHLARANARAQSNETRTILETASIE